MGNIIHALSRFQNTASMHGIKHAPVTSLCCTATVYTVSDKGCSTVDYCIVGCEDFGVV